MPAGRRRTELVFKLALVGRFDSPVYLAARAGDRARLFVVEQSGRIAQSPRAGARRPAGSRVRMTVGR